MAAKDSKESERAARAGLAVLAGRFLQKEAGKTLIDIGKLKKLEAYKQRMEVINIDTLADGLLAQILTQRFSQKDKEVKKLFDPSTGGPLVSLAHKARLAYALGIIDKTAMKDLENIHKIRNEFAHGIETDFANAEVLKYVANLSACQDHKVTARNSYMFYVNTIYTCLKSIAEAQRRE